MHPTSIKLPWSKTNWGPGCLQDWMGSGLDDWPPRLTVPWPFVVRMGTSWAAEWLGTIGHILLIIIVTIIFFVDHFDFPKRRNKVYQGLWRDFYGLVRQKDLFKQFFFGGSFLYQILVILFVGGVELEQYIYPRALWTEAVDGFICTVEQQPFIFLGGQRVLHLGDLWTWVTQSVT